MTKPPQTLFMLGQGGTFTVPVGSPVHTFVDFPGQIRRPPSQVFDNPFFDIKVVKENKLRVVPRPGAPEGARVQVHVDFVVNDANFDFVIVDRASAVEFLHVRVGSWEDLRAFAMEIAEPEITQARDETEDAKEQARDAEERVKKAEARVKEAENRTIKEKLRLQAKGVLDQVDGVPVCRAPLVPVQTIQRSKAAARINLSLLPSCWDEDRLYLLLPFELDNRDAAPFRPTQVEVRVRGSRGNREYPAEVVYPEHGNDPVLVSVAPHERARGVIAIKLEGSSTTDKMLVQFSEAGNERWLGATISAYSFMRAVVLATPADDWEREMKEREAREARATQLILSPSMSAGYCWLGIGVNGMSDVDGTSCFIMGGRLVKGITETFAFQAELLGGSTGAAEFEGFTRSANFGRATLGVMLRFGDMRIPYARAGVGAQGTSYTVSDGGPESNFEISFFWSFGAGFDARLGSLLLGAEVFGEQRMDDKLFQNSLGIGVHFGYGWNP